MKLTMFKRAVVMTVPLVLTTGAAWAAFTGVGQMDTIINTGNSIATGAGVLVGGMGLLGIVRHLHGGNWMGIFGDSVLGIGSGGILYNHNTIATAFGSAAAVVIHPATHVAIHAASRLLG